MLSNFLPDDVSEPTEVKTSFLKIRGKSLIFGNVVYQIHNITSIGLVDLSSNATYKQPMNKLSIVLFIIMIIALATVLYGFFSNIIVVIAIGAWLIYDSKKTITKKINKYGMTIYTNNGINKILVSRDKEFIKKVIWTLSDVMNSNEPKAITFNFETLDMSDKSIEIERNIGSPVVSGDIEGDIVNWV
ncbi:MULTISPECIES: DUF6232 family protein [Moorena]|uniref:DUF6232 family protein n=1 Tax=Moorena producens (strain JHB) TaxID=1454205 RepID=A0A1D9G602_MOOP1|nr:MULTISPECIES: DUF6232 family protein [Moorena]AOY82915.1 DUF6232 family protein [Moorena producens JHB]NER86003.1 hypothetical protein [Moorena sp. SIO3A2]NES40078.1 hypothetical protein [Moorena sp. SIO2C4]